MPSPTSINSVVTSQLLECTNTHIGISLYLHSNSLFGSTNNNSPELISHPSGAIHSQDLDFPSAGYL